MTAGALLCRDGTKEDEVTRKGAPIPLMPPRVVPPNCVARTLLAPLKRLLLVVLTNLRSSGDARLRHR